MGIDDPGRTLSAIIQLGSVFALIWYFRNDIFKLRSYSSKKTFQNFLNKRKRIFGSILIGTIPIILLGGTIKLFIPHFFDNFFRSNISIALVSFLMAFFMFIADSAKKDL